MDSPFGSSPQTPLPTKVECFAVALGKHAHLALANWDLMVFVVIVSAIMPLASIDSS